MKALRTPILFATALILFTIASLAPVGLGAIGMSDQFEAHPTLPHFIVKSLLLIFAVVAVALDQSRGWRDYGFQAATSKVSWGRVIGAGALLGAASVALVFVTPAQGMTGLRNFGLLGMLLSIWFYSSLSEEIFVRGWFQSLVDQDSKLEIGERSVKTAVLASGLLFGSLHFSLFFKGEDVLTGIIIVVFTSLLGLLAASYRDRYQSLVPAFVTHVAYNVGATFASIIFTVITTIAMGTPPQGQ